ncbi:5-formyltetrahydrofolate cyclo-ligase [Helicobacter canis]|uniref:5-formyltetrahydrofolate cyclo-ligase n=1 Tax=Helicobacter canis TaxID=29419 RepID=UPI0015F0591E|nr:5-formyltetrahydrofolate cyclo-ligase [Helicobacter canis]
MPQAAIYPLSAHKSKSFDSKAKLRAFAKAAPLTHNRYASRALCAYLESIITKHNFKRIALFYPLPHEPNILPLLKKLKKHKTKQVFLPTMQGLKVKMLPYRLPLVRNYLGIFEPKVSYQHSYKVDFVLIPALGIDMAFGRIGMGKGIYDRSFSARSITPYRVFVSQNLHISSTHITQEFDINAHQYISYTLQMKNIKGFYNVVDSSHRISRIRASCRIKRLSSVQKVFRS